MSVYIFIDYYLTLTSIAQLRHVNKLTKMQNFSKLFKVMLQKQ